MNFNNTLRGHTLVKTFGIIALALLLLVSIAGAAPYAYITTNSNTVSVIDTATNKVTATVNVDSNPSGVAVSPNGKNVYVTNSDSNTVSVIDAATNNVTATVSVGNDPIGVAVTPDGKTVYVANRNSDTVSVIDTAANEVKDTVNVGHRPYGIAVTPDGTKVYVTIDGSYVSGYVTAIDTATNTVTAIVPVETYPNGVSVTPDGKTAYVASNGHRSVVSGIDVATDTVTTTISVGGNPSGVTVTPDGKTAYVANRDSDTVSVIDTATNNVTATVNVGSSPSGVSVTPNGQRLYVVCGDSNVYAINTATNKIATIIMSIGSDWELGQFIGPLSKAPVANFTANVTQGSAPLSVQFTDTSTGTPTAWKWNFGDGNNSTVQNPTHKYSTAGNYTVTLTISNSAGSNTTTKTNYIKVTIPGPKSVANFTSNVTSGNVPLTVAFTDKSSGTPTKWKWTFGDGTNSTTKNPIHTYSKAGNYTVALTATNAAGSNTTTKTNYIKVKAAVKPVASFTSSVTSGYAPLSVTFTDTSTGIPTSWKWTFGDGTNSTVKNPTHTYSKAGNYTVSLTSTNAAGSNTTTKTNYIKVKTAPSTPVAAFSATPVSGTAPLTVSFTDSSIGTPTKWKWNFGDLKTSDVQNPSHVYKKAGTYTVSLTVKNANGTNTTTKTNFITVTNTPPVASFSATPTSGTAPLNVSFTDTSKGTPTKWKWDFGDLKTSKVQNPSHVYKKAGKYTVSLTVKNANGINTTTKANFVVVANK